MNTVGIFVALASVYIFGGPAFDAFTKCPTWLQSEFCRNISAIANSTVETARGNITIVTTPTLLH